MPAANVLPIAIAGEYRADGAFRALQRDLTSAKALGSQAQQQMVSLAGASNTLGAAATRTGNVISLAGRHAGGAGQMFGQLSFQINDIATGLAMGQSPFQILAQQGGQVYQVLSMQQGGVGAALSTIKGKLLELITPGRAVVLGFTAAAGAAYLLYKAVNDNAPTAEQALKEHARVIDIIKDAYREASKTAGEFLTQSKAITTLQAQQNIIALQNQLRSATTSAVKGLTTPTSLPSEMGALPPGTQAIENASVGATAFKALNQEIDKFNAGTRNAADVQTFRDAVAAIGSAARESNPELAKAAAEIIKNSAAAGEFAISMIKAEAGLRLLTGTATDADRKLLGLATSLNAYDQLIQRSKDRNEELKLEAQVAGQATNAVLGLKLQHEAERAAKQAGVKVNQQVLDQLKAELVLRTNLKAAAELGADVRFERQQLGRTPEEAAIAERLRSAKLDPSSAQSEFLAGQMRINQALTETRDLARDAMKGFIADLRAGKSAGEALSNVLEKVIDKMTNMAIDQVMASLFKPGGAGGASGFFASLFGGARAGGGPVSAGKAYVVGEKRPELFVPGTSGSIVPSLPNGGGGRSSVNIRIVNQGAPLDVVSQRSTDEGDLEVTVRSLVRDEQGSGRMNPVMRQKHGLNPQLRRR